MSGGADPFDHDDAAYVLGALDEPERAAYEAHLSLCAACRARVAELGAVLPALASVPEFVAADESDLGSAAGDPPDTLLPRMLREVRHRRARRRWVGAALAVAAAGAAVLTLIATRHDTPVAPVAQQASLRPVAATEVHATAAVTGVRWGTKIELHCTYESGYLGDEHYELIVRARDGHTEALGTWQVVPGRETTFTGGTALTRSDISQVLIAAVDGPTVLALDI